MDEFKLVRLFVVTIAALCVAGITRAATTATVTPGVWDGYKGTTAVTRGAASEAACVAALKARGVTAAYTCRTRTAVAVTVTVDHPPPPPPPVVCTTPKPIDELRAVACANTDTKWWNQTRTYASAAYPTCWSPSEWAPATPPDGACVVDPPPPPPTGGIVYQSPPIADATGLKAGETLRLRPGVYTSLKLKQSAEWYSIAADEDGTVTLPALNIGAGNWHVAFEGVKFKGQGHSITGSFVKLKNVAIEGGPATGNDVTLAIGTNDRTPGASDILLEDVWVYGTGGRYKVLVYNAQRVVLRRVTVRHDGGWTYDGRNPQGGFSLYDSKDVVCENCLFVDSVQNLNGFEAALYLVSNGTTSTHSSGISVMGSALIGSPNNGLAAEGQSAATYSVTDLLVSGSKAGAVNTNGAGHTLNVIGLTARVSGVVAAKWSSSGSLTVTNCKVLGGTVSSGAKLTTCPGGAGAVIDKKIGSDGAMWGEPGYADLTKDALWPWPNEARIKADFDSVRPAFGGKTLTEYVKAAQ